MSRHLRICALILAIAIAPALAACGGSGETPSGSATTATATTAGEPELGPAFGSMDDLPGVLTTSPPWPNNVERLQQRLRAIGLPALKAEGEVVHTHQHVDLFVDGERVPVPADIGIAGDGTFISSLHTHAPQPGEPPDGIMHVESPTQTSYTLGQFFAVWGVRLDATCVGARCEGGGKRLRAWVNGKPFTADPTRLVLEQHQQIVIAYGTAAQMPEKIPSSYDFGNL